MFHAKSVSREKMHSLVLGEISYFDPWRTSENWDFARVFNRLRCGYWLIHQGFAFICRLWWKNILCYFRRFSSFISRVLAGFACFVSTVKMHLLVRTFWGLTDWWSISKLYPWRTSGCNWDFSRVFNRLWCGDRPVYEGFAFICRLWWKNFRMYFRRFCRL